MALRLSKDIRSRLGKLPKDLKITYDEIFNEMTEGEIEIVDRALRWIMCLRAPLSTSALLPAVCQDGDETLKPVEDELWAEADDVLEDPARWAAVGGSWGSRALDALRSCIPSSA